jgi:hypothetical protein
LLRQPGCRELSFLRIREVITKPAIAQEAITAHAPVPHVGINANRVSIDSNVDGTVAVIGRRMLHVSADFRECSLQD